MSVECSVDRRTYPWCRVCLTSNVRMCSITNIKLREVYEKLTCTQADDDHGIPPVICFICCSLLRRARRFSEMAHRSQTILEEMRLQGVEAHQVHIMPNFGNKLNLSVTEICTISIPNYSYYQNARDQEIVSTEPQNTVAKVETVCDEENKLEEIHSTPEEDEIYDDNRDPTHAVPCDEVTVLDSLLSKDGVSYMTDNALINNELVHRMKDTNNRHLKRTSFVCNKELNKGSPLQPSLRTHTGEKPYKYKTCNKTFSTQEHLQCNIKIHIVEKPYKCENCNKTFTKKGSLKTHMRIHTGEKPYKCKTCNRTFMYKPSLNSHIRTHTGERPFICEICSKTFTQKTALKTHIRTHTGDKPYKCKTCNKTFLYKPSLKYHIRTHTGEKPYKCDICNKTFGQKIHMKLHIGTHTGEKPYKCKICDKTFSRKLHMILHMRTHTGERPHECMMCNKTFSRPDNLKQHIRTHTGEKRFVCNTCNRAFNRKSKFISHFCTHAG